MKYDAQTLARLIHPDRVHRNIYTDPEIFELEMESIFGKAWVYIGHESQVPKPGDFFTTYLGHQPVVMSRHTDGKIYVLHNRCSHRGAIVVNERSGNAKHLRCCYHGWAFKPNGKLAAVPLKNGYPDSLDLQGGDFDMQRVPRLADYHGFVFASLNENAPDFEKHLGGAKGTIDNMIARAPDGEVGIFGGVHKYEFPGNWKFQIENNLDHYHAPYAHECTTSNGTQFKRQGGEIHWSLDDKAFRSLWESAGSWGSPKYGHGYVGRLPLNKENTDPAYLEYKACLEARHGPERTKEILGSNRHNTVLYPNLCLQTMAHHVRVIRPIAVDRTEILVYAVFLKGAPDRYHESILRNMNVTHAAAALIQPDDVECFTRMQRGLRNEQPEWLLFGRGVERESIDNDTQDVRGQATDEVGMRAQYRAWKEYMCSAT